MKRSHEIPAVTCLLHLESISFQSENGDFKDKQLIGKFQGAGERGREGSSPGPEHLITSD